VCCWFALPLAPPLAPQRIAPPCSTASRHYGSVPLPALVHHRLRFLIFPMATRDGLLWPNAGPPKFRRDPFARDLLLEPSRVGTASLSGMLRSSIYAVSSPCDKPNTWLDHTPHATAVYALSPAIAGGSRNTRFQEARSAFLGSDLHRLIAPALLGAFGNPDSRVNLFRT
jgi:hypothetical protein